MKKNFYRAFEDKYRGSRELILGRLEFYRPFIEPLVKEFGRVPAIDLGCGRGEWLEVLLAAGLDARGVDLDLGMLQACADLGLPAEKGEAIAHLRGLPSKSQAVVSAFHVVEHIPFDALEELVSEAKRVLLPGGLLILETPNPENILVATCSFYLDPTHQRPIPPSLLSFVAEHVGFERVKVIRLQESREIAAKADLLLEDVLGGVSPDYSVVAQKKGKKSTMIALESVFSQDYGLTLSGLSSRYDAHMKGKVGEDRLKLIQEQLEAEKNRGDTLATERGQLAQRVTALESERSTLSSDNASLATSNSLLTNEREALQKELQEIHHANHTHWQRSEDLKQELAAKEQASATEREALTARLEELAGEAAVANAQREALQQQVSAKDEALAAIRETLTAERSAAELRLSTLSAEHSSLVAERNELATRHQLLVTEREALNTRVEEIAGEAAVARAQRESLRQEFKAKEQAWSEERSTLSSDNSSLVTSNSSLATRYSSLVAEHDALHQANHGHWQLSENLKQELAAKEQAWAAERSTLDARLSALLAEREALATSNSLLATERDALLASTCWRITAPIRWMRGGVRIPWPAPNEPLDDFFIKHAALYIRRRPHLKERALRFLFQNPKWHARVLPVLQGIKASKPSPQASQPIPQPVPLQESAPQPSPSVEAPPAQEPPTPLTVPAFIEPIVDLSSLTPHTRRIYADLKKAIEIKKGEVGA